MKKSKSGIIAILASDGNSPLARKALDIKTTSTYPSITIPKDTVINIPSKKQQLRDYQHLTIPPDLHIHFTSNSQERVFFNDLLGLVSQNGELEKDYIKVFTLINQPIINYPVFTERSYSGGGEIVLLPRLPHWNDKTGFILEIFATKTPHRNIPKEEHFSNKEVGTWTPIPYEQIYEANTNRKPTKYYLLPFIITYHKTMEHTLTFYPGSTDKPFREE